jgi:hypothetical protein
MPCTDELHRMQDKETPWKDAQAKARSAARDADIAGSAAGAACAFAFLSVGIGGAACAAALATMAHLMSKEEEADDLADNAKRAYYDAWGEYAICTVKTWFVGLVA